MTATSAASIRPLTPADHGAWLPLWRGYQAFYGVDLRPETTAVTWGRLIDPTEPVAGALAWDGGTAVGMVHHIRHRSTWTEGDYCYLQDLFVSAGQRGTGLGRALIAHVTEAARQAGCSRVYWLTHEDNAAARRLYDQVADRPGFIQYRQSLG